MNRDTVQEIEALNAAAMEARRVADGGKPYTLVPPDWEVRDLERLLPAPTRARGLYTFGEADSFAQWVKDRATDSTRIYGTNNHTQGVGFMAVMDDTTGAEAPAWGEWRAAYHPIISPEWAIWSGMNGKRAGQKDFAEFLEQNVDDVFSGSASEPPGAVLLELCSVLQATVKAEFSSAVRLSNGATQLRYAETVTASGGGNGAIEMPEMFFLGVPVFMGGPTYKVGARLRYRVAGNQLTLGYDLVRPHKVVELAANDIKAKISEHTGLAVTMGVPPGTTLEVNKAQQFG